MIEEEDSDIHLNLNKCAPTQRFRLEKYTNNAYWFKMPTKGEKAIALDGGSLRFKTFDPKALNQLFSLIPVNNSTPLN